MSLRQCLDCGQVGCCDSSPGQHATAHFHETGHPVIESAEQGEDWRWCFVHHTTASMHPPQVLGSGGMRITKFGHACVRVEYDGAVVVIDPGVWTEAGAVDGAGAVLITHEHPDHYSPDNLRATDAPVFTIEAVAEQIREHAPDVADRVTVVTPGEESRPRASRPEPSVSCTR